MPKSKVAQARIGWQKSSSNEEANRARRARRNAVGIQGSRHCPRLVDTRSVAVKYNMQGKRGGEELEMNTTAPLSHPLTAIMARRDNAMTGRRAINLQWCGMGQIREGKGR